MYKLTPLKATYSWDHYPSSHNHASVENNSWENPLSTSMILCKLLCFPNVNLGSFGGFPYETQPFEVTVDPAVHGRQICPIMGRKVRPIVQGLFFQPKQYTIRANASKLPIHFRIKFFIPPKWLSFHDLCCCNPRLRCADRNLGVAPHRSLL